MPEALVNREGCLDERNDLYHTKGDEISTEIKVPGLEGLRTSPSRGEARRSLVPFGQVETVRNGPLWAQWCDPCFSHQRGQRLKQAPTWALPQCPLVHAEASSDPRARPERDHCKKTSEFHGQSFTSQNQGR